MTTQWQPIETAPKDGTTIWLVEPGSNGVFAGRWLDVCFFVEDANDLWPSKPSHWQPYDKTRKPKHPGAFPPPPTAKGETA